MVDFTVRRDGITEDAVYDVDPLSDTANPFGDFCVVKIDDRGGDKFDQYNRGTALRVVIDDVDDADLLFIASGETTTTDTNTTNAYLSVRNQGTYSNQGTVTSQPGEIDRFDGYVVEARETEQSGADALEVEAYTFDQFLRRNTVSNDQTGNTIAEALESIVKNDTPVSYVANNIEVSDPQELTRSYRGESVEVVLRDLAFKSGNEAFGVNDSREFFFRPRETKHIDRGIDNTQWFNYDIPELGKDAINEVEVFFNDGNESVVIDAPTDKLELQDGLSLPEPGTQREELNRPLVTDIQDAEDIGRQYLQFRNATLSGTVTTFGLYDAEPGDTINITIESRGIDTEFRIAAVEYRWGRDETILTVVERRGDQDKILSRISESVKRQEMETADRDAPSNRITTTEANAIVDVDITADAEGDDTLTVSSGETFSVSDGTTEQFNTVSNAGTLSNQGTVQTADSGNVATPSDVRFVNPGRNAVRDAWVGDGNPNISTIAIGNDGSGLSRSNTDLNNQVTSASVTESLPTSTSADYSASINQTGVEEIGLTTSGGTLIARAVFDAPVDLAGTVTVTLDVSNDSEVQRGVLTNDGQTAVRDVLADNTPALPNAYGFGSGDTQPTTSDTVLDNEIVEASLTNILIQEADTQEQWASIVPTIPDTKPLQITNGELQTTKINNVVDTGIMFQQGGTIYTEPEFEGGVGRGISAVRDSNGNPITNQGNVLSGNVDSLTASVEFSHKVENPQINFRIGDGDANAISNGPPFNILINGEQEEGFSSGFSLLAFEWFGSRSIDQTFEAGDVVDIEFVIDRDDWDVSESYDPAVFDVWAVFDGDYSYTFDETLDENGGQLDRPSTHPEQIIQSLETEPTRRNVTEANFNSTWNNTDNQQYIEIANDGSNFTRFTNTQTGSTTFATGDRGLDVNLALSRFSDGSDRTPLLGNAGQSVSLWELFANPDAVTSDSIEAAVTRAVVTPNTITGKTIREAGLKSGNTLLTRHTLAEFTIKQDQRLASSETTRFKGTE